MDQLSPAGGERPSVGDTPIFTDALHPHSESRMWGNGMRGRTLISLLSGLALSACGCSKYASDYSCRYVENDAEYEVWYWRHVEDDREQDNKMIGHAIGVQQCEDNARAFAAAVEEQFNPRAYICILMKDGLRMEKHRNLIGVEDP